MTKPTRGLRLYRRMAGLLRPYLGYLGLSVLLALTVVVFETISLWFSAPLVRMLFLPDAVEPIKPALTFHNAYPLLKYYTFVLVGNHDRFASLKIVCVLMTASFALKNLLTYLKRIVVAFINLRVVSDLRNRLYSHALALPVTYYDRNRAGRIISLLTNDVTAVRNALTQAFDKILIEPVRVVTFIAMLFAISVPLTLTALIILPLLGFIIGFIGKAVKRRSRRSFENLAGLLAILHETVVGIRTVKMFNMHRQEAQKFKHENNRYIRNAFRSSRAGASTGPLTETIGVAVTVLLLWCGGREVLAGRSLGAEDFVLFLVYLYSLFVPLKVLAGLHSVIQNGIAGAERVFELVDRPVEPLVAPDQIDVPEFESEIALNEVNFTYPGTNEQVLNTISFTMRKGDIIALVGSSGCGKSTILDLLPRFYNVSHGSITIDGKNISTMDLAGLRHLFGIVAQETVLFNDTVSNNIAYGVANASAEQIREAARAAQALSFIEGMPKGFETIIGDRGIMLSGGQRQRLAIARALLKNPEVLILDEATSALDTESERLVQEAINTLMANRTALVVAHRLSTISHATRILVIEKGSIVEQGTHTELLALKGKYRSLYDLQFGNTPES